MLKGLYRWRHKTLVAIAAILNIGVIGCAYHAGGHARAFHVKPLVALKGSVVVVQELHDGHKHHQRLNWHLQQLNDGSSQDYCLSFDEVLGINVASLTRQGDNFIYKEYGKTYQASGFGALLALEQCFNKPLTLGVKLVDTLISSLMLAQAGVTVSLDAQQFAGLPNYWRLKVLQSVQHPVLPITYPARLVLTSADGINKLVISVNKF